MEEKIFLNRVESQLPHFLMMMMMTITIIITGHSKVSRVFATLFHANLEASKLEASN